MESAPKERRRQFAKESNRIAELAIRPIYLDTGGEGRTNRGRVADNQSNDDDFEWDNDYVLTPSREESRTLLSKGSGDGV